MADYKLSYSGQNINNALGEVINDEVIKYINQNKSDLEKSIARNNIAAATKLNIKTALDDVAVSETLYYLGEQTFINLSLPTTAELGQQIIIFFNSGDTATIVSCGDFNLTTFPNTINKIVFSLVYKANNEIIGDEDEWVCEIEEG